MSHILTQLNRAACLDSAIATCPNSGQPSDGNSLVCTGDGRPTVSALLERPALGPPRLLAHPSTAASTVLPQIRPPQMATSVSLLGAAPQQTALSPVAAAASKLHRRSHSAFAAPHNAYMDHPLPPLPQTLSPSPSSASDRIESPASARLQLRHRHQIATARTLLMSPSAVHGSQAASPSQHPAFSQAAQSAADPEEKNALARLDAAPPFFSASASHSPWQPASSLFGLKWTRLSDPQISSNSNLCLRSHSATLIHDTVFIFGGSSGSGKPSSNNLITFHPATGIWQHISTSGSPPAPRRAHAATAYGPFLIICGGGESSRYLADIAVLDTRIMRWIDITIENSHSTNEHPPETCSPAPRRAHTVWIHHHSLYMFGGGDGVRALSDLWRLAGLESLGAKEPFLKWEPVTTYGDPPASRGYHTTTLFGNTVVLFGGSDAQNCYSDVAVLDMNTLAWRHYQPTEKRPKHKMQSAAHDAQSNPYVVSPRLAHSAVALGPYLLVFGGHDGTDYSQQVRILDVQSMQWISDISVQRDWFRLPPSIPHTIDFSQRVLQSPAMASLSRSEPSTPAAFSKHTTDDLLDVMKDAARFMADMALMASSSSAASPTDAGPALGAAPAADAAFTLSKSTFTPHSAVHQRSVSANSTETQFTQSISGPCARGYHSTVLVGDRVYLFGGYDGSHVFSDHWSLEFGLRSFLVSIPSDNVQVGSRVV